MNFDSFIDWAFLTILTGCVIFGVNILFQMKENMSSLNAKIAVILEKITYHEREIEKHDDRIKELESGRFR